MKQQTETNVADHQASQRETDLQDEAPIGISEPVARRPLVQFIGCYYGCDVYSRNCLNLVKSLNDSGQVGVAMTTSNCTCFSSAKTYGITKHELLDQNCTAVKLPYATPQLNGKHRVLHLLLEIGRGTLFFWHARRAKILHFDQVLKAFGCVALFTLSFLARISGKRVVVTVHELDPLQKRHVRLNKLYTLCDRVIVFSEQLKRELVALRVAPVKLLVVHYGSVIPPLLPVTRSHFIFFGGHHLLKGKGYAEVLAALRLIKERGVHLQLVAHRGRSNDAADAVAMAKEKGVDDMIIWKDFLFDQDLAEAYQRSKACLIPYSGGSGRYPATCAMANATPVIATRAADLPEYLGELGIYVDGSAESLANAILELDRDPDRVRALGMQLRERALRQFGYDPVAQQLLEVYRQALDRSGQWGPPKANQACRAPRPGLASDEL